MTKIFTLFLVLSMYRAHAQPGCSTQTDVSGGAAQAGLYAEFFEGYHNDDFSYFPNSISPTNRIESVLNYTTNAWGISMPPASGTAADPDYFSARYRGSIYIATAGTYTFYLTSDDGSYMWIDNPALAYPTVYANALINNGGGHGVITISNSIFLNAGYHPIQIQYGDGCCDNSLVLEYAATSPFIPRQVVPNSVLCTGTPPPLKPTSPPGCPCNAGVSTDIYDGFYNDVQSFFTTNNPVIIREDERIYFTSSSFGNIVPPIQGTAANPDLFSVRFSGQIYIPAATTYTFYLTGDDNAMLWLDANALMANPTAASATINNGGSHAPVVVSAVTTLSEGLHDFKVHFGEVYGGSVCILEYASATMPRQIIPQTAYCSCSSTGTLPVELLNFSATKASDSRVLLNWETASEVNNKQFDIERSSNGIDFVTIGSVPAKGSGTSYKTNSYEWVDPAPGTGILYYRLRQVDQNQSFKLYKMVSVELNAVSPITFYVFPNPNNGTFEMSVAGVPENSSPEITIHTIDGRQVYNTRIDPSALENNKAALKVTPGFEKGLYIVNCIIDGLKFPVKLLIE